MKAHSLALLIQFFAMGHSDLNVYTIPNIGKPVIIYNQGQAITCYLQEANPISKYFQDSHISAVYEFGTDLIVAETDRLLSDFDNQHLKGSPVGTSDVFLASLVLMEINAIHAWKSYGYGPEEIKWTFARLPISI